MISGAQCRAGRAVLGYSQSQLSEESGVSVRAIHDFEKESRIPNGATLFALHAAFERLGVNVLREGNSISWSPLLR